MMKLAGLAVLAALPMLAGGAALAGDKAARLPPVLVIQPDLCPSTRAVVMDWARKAPVFGSFAVPRQTESGPVDCSRKIDARAAYAHGYETPRLADATAMDLCRKLNAGKTGIGPCLVIARLRPGE